METDIFTLIVRAPNQQIDDFVVKCQNSWTVTQLKNHLSEVYPHKPVADKQKLIYRGQLLNNSSYLKDIFKNHDDNNGLFTIHLMCNTIENLRIKNTQPNPPVEIRTNSMWNVNNFQNRDEIPASDINTNWNVNSQNDNSQYMYGQLNDGQVAWVQQAYMHYLSQYMQLMASQGLNSPYIPSINLPVSDNTENNLNNEEQRQPVQNNPDVINNNNNNNAGDDAAMNRDWLDNFYVLSRVIVLFSIVYFYSSPLRFVAVTLLGFMIYLYQAGYFRTHFAFANNNNNNNINNNNDARANENPVPERREDNNGETNESTNPENNTTQQQDNNTIQRPGILSLTWIFFSSFFASLIPDVPDVA